MYSAKPSIHQMVGVVTPASKSPYMSNRPSR